MDWPTFVNVIIFPTLISLGGLIVWLVKFYIPKIEERKDKELETRLTQQEKEFENRLEAQRDEQEYHQSTGNIAIDILRDYVREINAERAKEIDSLAIVIQANTKAVERQGQQVESLARSVNTLAGAIDQMRQQK